MEINNSKTDVASNRGYHLVRIGVAGLLLTASALKCWQLATEPVIGTSLLDSRWLLMATVEFEIFFGIWLLADIWAKPTWAAALACFVLFTCVSVCKGLSGYATCGCFGRVVVNPWYTSGLDLMVLASLLRWRPKESFFAFGRAIAVVVVWILIGVPAGVAMGSYTPSTLSEAGTISGDGKTIVLRPENWIGKRFPLLNHIDTRNVFENGKWLVLLYHYDCPKCQETIKTLSHEMLLKRGDARVALIEVPPYGETQWQVALLEEGMTLVRLDGTRNWVVATPTKVRLDSGEVMAVTTGNNNQGKK